MVSFGAVVAGHLLDDGRQLLNLGVYTDVLGHMPWGKYLGQVCYRPFFSNQRNKKTAPTIKIRIMSQWFTPSKSGMVILP